MDIKKEFRKHYKYSLRLKEGGAAWEREMTLCEKCLAEVRKELWQEIK